MPAKTQNKNGKKAQAKAPVSKTPLLDAAKINNPHKPVWNREAALQIAQELAANTRPDMLLSEYLALAEQYKMFTGWTNGHEAVLNKYGLKRLKNVPAPVA